MVQSQIIQILTKLNKYQHFMLALLFFQILKVNDMKKKFPTNSKEQEFDINVATSACSSYSQADCLNTGYCKWDTTCVNQDCYLVTEASACRTQGAFVGALVGTCIPVDVYSLSYDNVCMDSGQTTVPYPFIRLPFDNSGSPTQAVTGYLVQNIMTTLTPSQYVQQLFTVNAQKATSSQLSDILDAYIHLINLLLTQHPYYIEKIVVDSLQNIRDDVTLIGAPKQALLTKVWTIADQWRVRVKTFKSQYTSDYYFLQFASTALFRLQLAVVSGVSTNQETITATWTSYSDNGYLSMIYMKMSQFGIYESQASGGVSISVQKSDGSSLSTPLTIVLSWQWTNSYPGTNTVYLYQYNQVTFALTASGIAVTCVSASKTCTTASFQISSNVAYQFSEVNANSCVGKAQPYCRLISFALDFIKFKSIIFLFYQFTNCQSFLFDRNSLILLKINFKLMNIQIANSPSAEIKKNLLFKILWNGIKINFQNIQLLMNLQL
ncbi:hypothetical protein pb186bvf_009289 [Paramecium bursaria]